MADGLDKKSEARESINANNLIPLHETGNDSASVCKKA